MMGMKCVDFNFATLHHWHLRVKMHQTLILEFLKKHAQELDPELVPLNGLSSRNSNELEPVAKFSTPSYPYLPVG